MMRRKLNEERGIAVPIVVAVIAVISILGLTAAYMVESQTTMGARYSGGEKALAIAEAGVNEYLWHLNGDSKFYEDDGGFSASDHTFQDGFYHLAVTPPDTENPVVTITSTGWPEGDLTNRRTVEVRVHKRQFVQNIYLSEVETALNGPNVCWITGDELWGPLHTNGTLYIDGDPIFHGPVTYSGGLDVKSGSDPTYEVPGYPLKVPKLEFPQTNGQLKTQAQYNGYYYDGRTCILLDGDQVKIRNRTGDVEIRPLPRNGVIYVDGTTNESNNAKWDLNTGNAFVSGKLDGRLTIATAKDIYITGRDPTNFTYNLASATGGVKYKNEDFDPDGGMTDDMLGLVAGGYVRILHHNWPDAKNDRSSPYYSTYNVSDVAPDNITVDAAIFALDWAWEYEDHDSGEPKGSITLVGSLTQYYRGEVGTFNAGGRVTGYSKNYIHDPRMSYDSPPHFLEPVNVGWEIGSWREVPNP
ncbi:MAG: hypothetical protein ACYC0Q_04280 [Eubacteriales bacterium]